MNSKVHIRVSMRDGKSFLKDAYFTPPFKVADITEDREGGDLLLMLMCSSPGMLNGDVHEMKLDLEEGCRLHLHTQGYQRLFDMKEGATQQVEIHLGKNASLSYLPHPSVPHANSIWSATNRIFLSEGCRLVWGDILSSGRKGSGESFRYSSYRVLTEIYQAGKRVVRENICLRPSDKGIHGIGMLEGFTHQASLLVLPGGHGADAGRRQGAGGTDGGSGWGAGSGGSVGAGRSADMLESMQSNLQEEKDIQYGFSALPVDGWVVRILGYRAEQLYDCLKKIAGALDCVPK